MAEDWGFGAALDASAKAREVAESQGRAVDQAGSTIKQGSRNIRAHNEASGRMSLAKIDAASTQVKMKVAQAQMAFQAVRTIATVVAGVVSAKMENDADRETNIDRARAITENQGIANERMGAGGEHEQALGNGFGLQEGARGAREHAEQALHEFDAAHSDESGQLRALSPAESAERAGLRETVQTTRQQEEAAGAVAVAFASRSLDPNTVDIPGRRNPQSGEFEVDGEAFLRAQGVSDGDISRLSTEQREAVRDRLQQIYNDRQTQARGGNAGEFVQASDELSQARQEKSSADQELQAAHQSGDQDRISRAEARSRTAGERVDAAERRTSRAEGAFQEERTRDQSFWQGPIARAIQPFFQEMLSLLLTGRSNSDGSSTPGMMGLIAQYNQAMQAMTGAAEAAGRAAKEAESLDLS